MVLAERDNNTCQLCCVEIDAAKKWPESESASIDHIVPLVDGGEHSYANTQLTHLSCNIKKGARSSR